AIPGGMVQQFAPVAQAFQQPVVATAPASVPPSPQQTAPAESVEGYYGEAAPIVGPVPGQPVLRMPPGWIQRPSPYQGKKGRRVYLRCVAWPGSRGLVPAMAAQAPAGMPAAAAAAATPVAPRAARGPRLLWRHH